LKSKQTIRECEIQLDDELKCELKKKGYYHEKTWAYFLFLLAVFYYNRNGAMLFMIAVYSVLYGWLVHVGLPTLFKSPRWWVKIPAYVVFLGLPAKSKAIRWWHKIPAYVVVPVVILGGFRPDTEVVAVIVAVVSICYAHFVHFHLPSLVEFWKRVGGRLWKRLNDKLENYLMD
jgi:hypothetical protein